MENMGNIKRQKNNSSLTISYMKALFKISIFYIASFLCTCRKTGVYPLSMFSLCAVVEAPREI